MSLPLKVTMMSPSFKTADHPPGPHQAPVATRRTTGLVETEALREITAGRPGSQPRASPATPVHQP